MKYYLKRLQYQELGSIKSNGKASRGRYIYISKNQGVLSFFPPLSQVVKNDSSLLPIIPLYSEKKSKIYTNYVYHNDKFSCNKGTRDEYRIYCNNELELNKYLFKEEDILIFKRDNIKISDEDQIVYFVELLNNKNTALYRECNEIIEKSSIKGSHALYDGVIEEIEDKIKEFIKDNNEINICIDNSVTKDIQEKSEKDKMASLFNANSFRDFIMFGYNNKCAVTGNVIRYENYTNLEAAHIKPKSHGGLFLPNNGLALCRDLHWAFDKGFYTLSDDFKIIVHPKTTSDYLKSFEGKQIYIPNNPFFIPDLENIRYHRENVYGLFLTTGRL